jgi:hypothetical protein
VVRGPGYTLLRRIRNSFSMTRGNRRKLMNQVVPFRLPPTAYPDRNVVGALFAGAGPNLTRRRSSAHEPPLINVIETWTPPLPLSTTH